MAYLYVNPDGVTRPYSTIAEAQDAASNGDVLVLDPGTYTEDVNITKAISLKGNTTTPENDDVLIQPQNPDPQNYVVRFAYTTAPTNVTHYLEGITFRMNADAHDQYVFYIASTSASHRTSIISNRCKFIYNKNGYNGRIIYQGYQNLNDWWFDHCDILMVGTGGTNWTYSYTRLNGQPSIAGTAKIIACRYDRTPNYLDNAGTWNPDNYVVSTTTVSGYGPQYSTQWYIPNEAPVGYFDGYITEEGTPVQRKVYLYNRVTGELMADTVSNPSGYYYMETTSSGMHHIVALDAPADPLYNDLIIGSATPTLL